jgi:hypothetical protein
VDTIIFYIVWGFIFMWSLAFIWAFFRISSDTLSGMINGTFTLPGIGWSAFCAVLALIPLWIALWAWARWPGYWPG